LILKPAGPRRLRRPMNNQSGHLLTMTLRTL
jgi:hypothetical protein